MIRVSKSKKWLKMMKRGTACALAAILFLSAPVVQAKTKGEDPGENKYFATKCYYNRKVNYSSKKCSVTLTLFKNATTTTELTTNPQTLAIKGKQYYLNGKGDKVYHSLNVSDNRQITIICRMVSLSNDFKYVCGYADFMVAASKQGKTLEWNN